MKTNKRKFAGTFLASKIENNKKLYYAWNEYRPIKIIDGAGFLRAMYMRVLIGDKVYFISDNSTIDTFLNMATLLNSSFFLEADYDMTEVSQEKINEYFYSIS